MSMTSMATLLAAKRPRAFEWRRTVRRDSKVTADTVIRCDPRALWDATQSPEQHVRWGVRFSAIQYLPKSPGDAAQRFRYATRIGFGLSIEGWGETVGEKDGLGSALRFGSDDPQSLIRDGTGCWTYRPAQSIGAAPPATRFGTVFDYRV